ncbi:CCC motif membrane protein [Nonlabens xiamenensis]|uniref:CCC motif membrane protein n=1 Tax=Nonlabens xiamenensis TaxID=2341043 RepID=UPI000F606398|nr:CCC motif membrane protein [Nonlabens xiamenensis]
MQENNPNYTNSGQQQPGSPTGQRSYRYDYEGEKLVNDPAALTIAIISLVLYLIGCICYGLLSILTLVGSIIAWVMANKAIRIYRSDPERYSRNTYKSVNAGKIIGIIGAALSGVTVLFWLIMLIFFGAVFSQALDGKFDLKDFQDRAYDDYDDGATEDLYETTDDDWEYMEDDQDSLEMMKEPIIEIEEVPIDSI